LLESEAARGLVADLAPPRPLLFPAGDLGLIRLVASWDTTIEDVDDLLARIAAALA